ASWNCSIPQMKQRRSVKSRQTCCRRSTITLKFSKPKSIGLPVTGAGRSPSPGFAERKQNDYPPGSEQPSEVNRLKEMLLAFMMSRGLRKLEGDKSAV